MKRTVLIGFAMLLVFGAVSSIAGAKKKSSTNDATTAITKLENDAVKADLAGDSSFVEKNYAEDWTGGF